MTIAELWNPLGTLVSRGFSALARIMLKAGRRGIPRVRTNKESEKAMATVKTEKSRTAKEHAPDAETPAGDRKSNCPKKVRKVNLKDLVDDDDDGDKLVGGVAGALLGGVAGALLGGILGVVAESFKSASSDDDYEVEVDEDGNIEVGGADDADDDEAACEDEEEGEADDEDDEEA